MFREATDNESLLLLIIIALDKSASVLTKLDIVHRTSVSATMSNFVKTLDNAAFVVAMFLEAARVPNFQHRANQGSV